MGDAVNASTSAAPDIAVHVFRSLGERLEAPSQMFGTTLLDDLAITSLDRLEAMMCLEDEFGIEFTDRELNAVRTVGDVIALIALKLQASLGAAKVPPA
jgi:acyl carrier protein